MIILVDLDGPTADFDAQFFTSCANNGWTLDCTRENQTRRFATDHLPSKRERAMARDMVNARGWFRHLPVVDGALEGLNQLETAGLDVWLCTKPLEQNPSSRDDKAAWVSEYLGRRWEEKLILTPNKSMVRGDILLDDAPALGWLADPATTWRPVIFPTAWNGADSKWDGLPRWTWGDPIESLITVSRLERDRMREVADRDHPESVFADEHPSGH